MAALSKGKCFETVNQRDDADLNELKIEPDCVKLCVH